MATAETSSPYADHRAFAQAGGSSPFRSESVTERRLAAKLMLANRREELVSLEAALASATTTLARKNLRLRIQGTKNNLKAWSKYLEGSDEFAPIHRERYATMTPEVDPNPLIVK